MFNVQTQFYYNFIIVEISLDENLIEKIMKIFYNMKTEDVFFYNNNNRGTIHEIETVKMFILT